MIPCPECNGTGWADSDNTLYCDFCNGRGQITELEYEDWASARDQVLREGPVL